MYSDFRGWSVLKELDEAGTGVLRVSGLGSGKIIAFGWEG